MNFDFGDSAAMVSIAVVVLVVVLPTLVPSDFGPGLSVGVWVLALRSDSDDTLFATRRSIFVFVGEQWCIPDRHAWQ